MANRLTKHLLSVIGAIVTIGGLLSLLTSGAFKTWIRNHSYWVFLALILSITTAFVVVDYVRSMKRREATEHDRSVVAKILGRMPPDGKTIIWLKESYISKYAPVEYLDILDAVHDQIQRNVVGLDNAEANQACEKLKSAIGNFHSLVSVSLFMDDNYKTMNMSQSWPSKQWKEASHQLNETHDLLVQAYDDFLRICHRNQLV